MSKPEVFDITWEDDGHSDIGPSGWKTWGYCSASPGLVKSLGLVDPPKEVTEEGTVAHWIHERCFTENHNALFYKGRRYRSNGFTFRVTEGMHEAVQASLDYIKCRVFEAEAKGLTVTTMVEAKLDLKFLKIKGLDKGTADIVLLFFDGGELVMIEVIDYKHGAGVAVYPEENGQAMMYALGALNHPAIKPYVDDLWEADELPIKITINQPRCMAKREPSSSWDTTLGDLVEWQENELKPRGRAVSEPNPKFAPGEEACQWCLASRSLDCPAIQGYAESVAMIDFDDEADADYPKVTTKQKLWLISNAKLIRGYLKKAETAVSESILRGEDTYTGIAKAVAGKTNRKLNDGAFDTLEGTLTEHLEYDEMYIEKPRSMTELERTLIKKLGREKGLAVITENVYKPDSQLTVVPLDDPRESVAVGDTDDFDGLEDEDW